MKIVAVDSNSILNRAFYGVRLLSNKDGVYTNAIHGFMNIIAKVIDEIKPDGFAFAFDLPAPTFRHEMYGEYKAGRKGMPDELAMQLPLVKKLLSDLGYAIVECPGYEADDILGTLAHICDGTENECVVVTGDRDCLQLVSDKVHVRLASTKGGNPVVTLYDPDTVRGQYGVTPRQLIEVKALMGDSSDNIPGVAGIGEKTALDLISRFDGVDYIYENLETLDIKPGVRNKLREGEESARISRKLGEIVFDAPISNDMEAYRIREGDPGGAVGLLKRLEMYKLIERLGLDLSLSPAPSANSQTGYIPPKLVTARPITSLGEMKAFMEAGERYYLAPEYEGDIPVELAVCNGGEAVYADTMCLEFQAMLGYALAVDKPKIVADAKAIYRQGLMDRFPVNGIIFDASLAGYILNPLSKSYDLPRLADEYGNGVQAPLNVPSVQSAVNLSAVHERMQAEIEENKQQFLLHEVELPLARVLASMEVLGFDVDTDGIRAFGQGLTAELNELEQAIYEEAGEPFNINSPKQLGHILFEKLGLPAKKKTKSGYSTSAEVLEELQYDHPIIARVLEYRQLSKLNSTYVEGLLKEVDADGRVHTRFNQTETRTGRISSTEPNMQNIPVRTELGREMRRFFHATPGKVLVDADYSQIELRVLAHIAEDANMLEAFREGADIHTITASQVFGVPVEMVTPKMRSDSKAVNFGIVYGISAFSLSKDIGVTVREAKKYIDDYLENFSGVRDYMHNTVEYGKSHGYVKTLFGRRRKLPELAASNRAQRAFGERVAMNMPIQGTAADIIKIAMVKVYQRLEREEMESRLILQVHDELIIEAPEREAERAAQILKEEMENAVSLNTPLVVDVNMGTDWYQAKG